MSFNLAIGSTIGHATVYESFHLEKKTKPSLRKCPRAAGRSLHQKEPSFTKSTSFIVGIGFKLTIRFSLMVVEKFGFC